MKKNILVIDDNHDILDLFEILLFKNYNVITSLDGFDGLKKASEFLPALIITDIAMPVMDGIRFLNHLNKQEKTKGIPVIAVTSFIRKHSEKSLRNIGFKSVIPKPFTNELVSAAIREAGEEYDGL